VATAANLSYPGGVAIDTTGNLLIADTLNNRIRKVTSAGIITTIAGTGPSDATGSFGGDGGLATAAKLAEPLGLVLDRFGNLFIADCLNNRVRELNMGPGITATGVVNAASGAAGSIAPGEFVTIYGSGLGPSTPIIAAGLSLGIDTTNVLFNGVAAFITYVSAGQINAIVPYEIAGSSEAQVQVEFQGSYGNTVVLPVTNAVPGIFTMNTSGTGAAVAVNQDGTFNSSTNPAARNSIVSFWATGQGQTSPPGVDGQQPQPPFPSPVLPVSVSIGGVAVPSGDVVFDGLVYAGVMQINAVVPATVSPGNSVELLLQVGSSTSLKGVTLPAVTLSVK